MRTAPLALIPALIPCLLLAACDDDGGEPTPQQVADGGLADGGAPDQAPAPTCDDSQPPLVMAHGFLASGDTWSPHARRFAANGHCPDRYVAFDWDTLNRRADHAAALDAVIDDLRAATGAAQVDLMGHSAGGNLGYEYLADPARAAKVAHYVHVGSFANEGPAGPPGAEPVPTLNIWSPADTVVEGADIPGAQNLSLPDLDHYAVATDPAAFEGLYTFLYGAAPATTAVAPAEPVWVAGRAAELGGNAPAAGAALAIWPVDPLTGQRVGARPEHSLTVGDDGAWGPVEIQPGVPYEFHVTPTGGGRQVHYYREAFQAPDPLVYLRTLPTSGLAGTLLGGVPFANAHTVVIVFSARQAVIAGRDTLALNGEALATEELASPEDTLIALFAYDQEVDGQDGGPLSAFSAFPFLNGVDRYIPADATRAVTAELNGRFLAAPRWPSAADGAVVFVFE
ncbi:MAG: hypothetical protein H6702_09175 [Myxococcales bacterium]|nr:hypothetical protein [Myxococcales bacterium]